MIATCRQKQLVSPCWVGEDREGMMSVTEQRWSRPPWTLFYRSFCKGSSISSLILRIGVRPDPYFGPLFPSIYLLSSHISSVLLPYSHDTEPWHWALTSPPPLSSHYPWGPHPPGPAFQTLFFQKQHFPSTSQLSTFCWLPESFPSFPGFAAAYHFLSLPSPYFPRGDQDLTQYGIIH